VNRRYQIILAHSGEDGVEAALKERPHLVILDLSLPGMSGKEVAERLRLAGILPDVPLIIASGEAQGLTDKIQASAYLVKPFPMARLVAAVQAALKVVA
jgi:two-component system phosphate regulon response regulator PhoB